MSRGSTGRPEQVYVAMIREDLSPKDTELIVKDAVALKDSSHPNVLKLVGVCFSRCVCQRGCE